MENMLFLVHKNILYIINRYISNTYEMRRKVRWNKVILGKKKRI